MDFDLTKLTTGHGSPEDRGGADFWYPDQESHWYPNGTYNESEILEKDMTPRTNCGIITKGMMRLNLSVTQRISDDRNSPRND